MLRALRIFLLLLVLAAVALGTLRTRSAVVQWDYTLVVNLYPVNGDGAARTARHIAGLGAEVFSPIGSFMLEEARRYSREGAASIEIRLWPQVTGLPPQPPQGGSVPENVWWSLGTRWWSWRHGETRGPGPQVKLFLVYHDPAQRTTLPHSTGLRDGLVGVVNVFASGAMDAENNVVIAHEFLHTLGASDKYDPATNQPRFPDGYADPELEPLHPQAFAEIMAGRIAVSESSAVQPRSLNHVVIGPATAREINWVH
jgi:hypothetical protein